ncbi:MAG: HAMP domain-containing protein [Proteobacteria bacterium]|nr:HAMP domain-containing protein [Pseudomonadota bacterium]MBU1056948.1 HAMP domain-containing protein [Pseudomonadota bacterium]
MRFFFLGSIRKSLFIVVLLAVLPALAILLYTGHELRGRVVNDAERYAMRQLQAMAYHHQRVVDNARLLLMTLAKSSQVQELDVAACQELLVDILARNAAYVSLSLVDAQGQVLVTVPTKFFEHTEEKRFYLDVMRMGTFTVGNYTLLKNDKRRVVVQFVQPVINSSGQPVGILAANFDLNYFGHIFYEAQLPDQSVFTLTDAKSIRLTRFPETEKYTWVDDLPQMVEHMSGRDEEGTFQENGVDGISRLYSFKRLHFQGASFPYLMIRLGIPVNQALADARFVTVRNIVLLLLATILALITAEFVADFTIMRRLHRLMVSTDKLKAGDLTTRTGMGFKDGELGQLAVAFDSMAEGLEHKEKERQQAAEQLVRLNEELEERVTHRTEQLASANQELQSTLEDLQRMQDQLILSEKLAALGELVAGVAHEINTPVGVALSAGSTLAEKNRTLHELFTQGDMKRSDLTTYLEDSQEGTNMILVNLERASELIRSFKMVAVDQVSENRRTFNVKKYIDEVLLSLRPKIKKTSHRIEILCDSDLMIDSYPGAFSQILTNFIINSLVHAFDPGQAGEIRIEVSKTNNHIELHYRDNGKGMPTEVRDRVFEPFFTTARSQGSTGLGLHIVFNIVSQTLGGTITCESEPGQGTSFHVIMPV